MCKWELYQWHVFIITMYISVLINKLADLSCFFFSFGVTEYTRVSFPHGLALEMPAQVRSLEVAVDGEVWEVRSLPENKTLHAWLFLRLVFNTTTTQRPGLTVLDRQASNERANRAEFLLPLPQVRIAY